MLNLKNKGMKSLMTEVLNNYSVKGKLTEFIIEDGSFETAISRDEVESNALMKKIQKYFLIDFNESTNLLTKWGAIRVKSKMNKDALDIKTIAIGEKVKILLKIELSELSISTDQLIFCEVYNQEKQCHENEGLYTRFKDIEINLVGEKNIEALIEVIVDIQKNNNKIDVKFNKIISNLSTRKSTDDFKTLKSFSVMETSPEFSFNFKEFYMPPPVLHINGESIELDVTEIQKSLLEEQVYFSNLIAEYAGKFMTNDIVEIFNKEVMSEFVNIASVFRLIDYKKYKNLKITDLDLKTRELSFQEEIAKVFNKFVDEAEYDLGFNRVRDFKNKDINIFLDSSFRLNGLKYDESQLNTYDTSAEFSEFKDGYDFGIAINPLLINSIFGMGINSGLVREFLKLDNDFSGVEVKDLDIILGKKKNIFIVSDLFVDLGEVIDDSLYERFKTNIGSIIEGRFNWTAVDGYRNLYTPYHYGQPALTAKFESGKIWFPLEIEITFKISNKDDRKYLELKVLSPIENGKFKNSFNRPMKDMSGVVKKAVISKIQKSFEEISVKSHLIDLSSYLSPLPGIELEPVEIINLSSDHLSVSFNIKKLKVKEIMEFIEDE